jgi:hypothetical protein
MRLKDMDNDTTLPRAALAVAAGALAGTVGVVLWTWWGMAHGKPPIAFDLAIAWRYFKAAISMWLVAILVFGTPPWILLHGSGYRTPIMSAVAGAALAFIVSLGLTTQGFGLRPHAKTEDYSAWDSHGAIVQHYQVTAHGWDVASRKSALAGLLGGIVALVMWRVAYRRKSTRDATPI